MVSFFHCKKCMDMTPVAACSAVIYWHINCYDGLSPEANVELFG